MKIGVISDTHNVLRDDVLIYLKECDYIIHAGDVCKEEIIERLNEIANTFVVRGNNDKFEGFPDYLGSIIFGVGDSHTSFIWNKK